MDLEIVTPEKKVFEGEVLSVTFPGTDGSFQILNSHAPLISSLKKGTIVYKDKKNEYQTEITGGMVEVLNNQVVVLAESVIE